MIIEDISLLYYVLSTYQEDRQRREKQHVRTGRKRLADERLQLTAQRNQEPARGRKKGTASQA